ncbi:unnamed protein product [Heligmosomoides polygyrus]|uniref:Transposase n=1 Tax=Heligmosomoides polygyrus TaxID=6339 RepID=A0A3P8AP91_HELPZ|nr:unnamed protein product [Heligmosomoides polygyrus]
MISFFSFSKDFEVQNKDDTNIDACLEQLARAISAHVTDILIERLGLEERLANTHESSTSKQFTRESNSPADGKLGNDPVRLRMVRYHSENRLNRIEPPPDINETPLENRASRLRRAIAGKKLATRGELNHEPFRLTTPPLSSPLLYRYSEGGAVASLAELAPPLIGALIADAEGKEGELKMARSSATRCD